MGKARKRLLLLLVISLVVVSGVVIAEKTAADKPTFTIRKMDKQVVLYTIYRGSYDKSGMAVGKLFALAGQKAIIPRGPVSYAYLNNPNYISSEHWLTEIRIPVGEEALKFAGTLGEMTDIKALPAMEAVVAIKPEGQADSGPIYDSLYNWIAKQGYRAVDAYETFLGGGMAGNYAQMKSEIIVPLKKFSKDKD